MSDWIDHALARVAATPAENYPFPHRHVMNVFPADVYHAMLDARHEAPLAPLTAKYKERKVMWLGDKAEPKFWKDFSEQLLSDRFAAGLSERVLGEPDAKLKREGLLMCDGSGYAIGPHTDDPRKRITTLFYLPENSKQAHLGTAIYVAEDGRTCKTGEHYGFDGFDRVKSIPFLPNSALIFERTDTSFHGREPIPEHEEPRWLLVYDLCTKLHEEVTK